MSSAGCSRAPAAGRASVRSLVARVAVVGVSAIATLGIGAAGSAVAAGAQPKLCSLLRSTEITALLGGASAASGASRTEDSPQSCAYQSSTTGAEFEIERSTVSPTGNLRDQSKSSIAGYLDCSTKVAKVTGAGGELGYYCGPPSAGQSAALAIEKGSVSLTIHATNETTKAACLAAAATIFTKLHAK
ncbi:MAG TPA: hypothetical protein VL977_03820 [Solirubrobacteraceae bacterium]|nr:hypothetical protein [Solirubrobacteraceae bacterium]